ncbi:tetratricopeptide repeat protein [Maribellus sp. CM-23]|uniref:tetratricopeptide repeat protein n=1 Tax=Maribellus sp. CM-23 TaxID=2781026 RepID=UPI001F23DE5B|nr:tetratricopeptide repeat protein [Maribellus sp. CM-23]MCE4566475.1 tetratricopeptide repeat protein [Maribellus sp. CM-23]
MEITEQLDRVKVLLKNEKASEAKEAFDLIGAFNSVDYFLVKGSIEQKFQHWGEAINAYNRVIEIDPDNEEAKNNLHLIQNILNFWNPDQYNP